MRLRLPLFLALFALSVMACSRPSGATTAGTVTETAPIVSVRIAAPNAPASSASSASSPPTAAGGYPVGRACSGAAAIAKEKKTLPPTSEWQMLESLDERVRLRIPPHVFRRTEETGGEGLRLTSAQKASGLGPNPLNRHFEIRVRRVSQSVDAVLADRSKDSPLRGVYLDEAFPKRTASSFVVHADEPMHSGSAVRATLGGKPAWIWVNGAEGYNSDYVLIELGTKDTVVVVADWNSSIMMGQPECWQRAVIGGVVESIESDLPTLPTQTVAGKLEVVTIAALDAYELRLAGKRLVRADARDPNDKRAIAPMPSVVRSFGALGDFDEVLLVRWDGKGNACNGYGFQFLQLMKDGTAKFTGEIPWCGGPSPIVTTEGPRVTITSPKHPPNRGTGEIAEESFVYEAGKVAKK